ncbi:MAG: hypothetical protein GEU90_18860 [Gemmatimonas sp.]|nr:hypothetical protein [Gemmatimonas sp.]
MSMRLDLNLYGFEIRPWDEVDPNAHSEVAVVDTTSLDRIRLDPFAMTAIRDFLSRDLWLSPIERFSDDEVIGYLARHLTVGRVRLLQPGHELSGQTETEDAAAPNPAHPNDRGDSSQHQDPGTAAGIPVPNDRPKQRRAAPSPPASSPRTLPGPHWITFRLVDDDTGKPVASVKLRVKAPDGTVATHRTGADGVVHIAQLIAGTCDLEEVLDQRAFEVLGFNPS